MGWQNDLRRGLSAAQSAATEVLRDGVAGVESWASERADNRRMADFDDRMAKAAAQAKAAGNDGTHAPSRDPKAVTFDPFDLVSLMGYREKPSELTYSAMESIANGVPVIADAIRVRATQVQTFCQRPEDRHAPGFKVRPKDRNAKVTKKVEARCLELEEVILNCGWQREGTDNVGLREFCGMFVKDSLAFDQACFEVVPDRKGDPSYIAIVDPTTVRLLDPIAVEKDDDPFAVQVVQGMIVSDFTERELAFCVRHPRSGIKSYGYGQSEVETLVREITGFLWGIEYNRRFFSQGSATKGILNLKGTIPDKHLQAFRRQWYAQVAGVNNAWRTPITNAEEIQWVSMQMSNKDMEMSAWMDFLIKIVCARFQIAPEEINFSYGNTGQSAAMGNVSVEEKIKASRDLGLRPLVQFFFDSLNLHFLSRIDPNYEVVPVNLDSKGADAELDMLQKQQKLYLTVNEAREQVGLEPLEDKLGEVILDPTWLQWAQTQDMGDEGEFDDEEGGEFDDGEGSPEGGDDGAPPEDDDGPGYTLTGPDGEEIPPPGEEGEDEDEEPDDEPDNAVAKSATGGIPSARPTIVRFIDVDVS